MEKMSTEHVIGCSNNTKGQERPQTTKKGVLLNRAYAMVTGGEFEDHKLMRLRIPLDTSEEATEWNGRWSDNSSAWTNRLRQVSWLYGVCVAGELAVLCVCGCGR